MYISKKTSDIIREKIKELDKDNKIKDINVYTKDDDVYIIFDDVFKVIIDKWNAIFCRVNEDWDNAVDLYMDNYIDLLDYYIFFPTFFKENKNKIKAIRKEALEVK
ncbi:hypothetical protein [Brachyspira hyodysenteriae]|uniref:hypothetical protein n=1 Tax=Brachyspira hyodysenteriae TaxID=159 RepID=UPI00063DC7F3|nr:hypothetical protein [Brachyspira hyodysenteriae]KLI52652.1 hypothetical protein SZ44_13895 [Brachyspira hyodysenteriae]HJH55064.1 hypothetical protein [Brachyspira hyodysenteriae]